MRINLLTPIFLPPHALKVCLSAGRKMLTLWAAAAPRYCCTHLRAVRSCLLVTRGNWTDCSVLY